MPVTLAPVEGVLVIILALPTTILAPPTLISAPSTLSLSGAAHISQAHSCLCLTRQPFQPWLYNTSAPPTLTVNTSTL